jgi:hypothetical protein
MHYVTTLQKVLFPNNPTRIFGRGFKRMASSDQAIKDILGFEVKDIDGNPVSLSKYKGFVSLIVNVASK